MMVVLHEGSGACYHAATYVRFAIPKDLEQHHSREVSGSLAGRLIRVPLMCGCTMFCGDPKPTKLLHPGASVLASALQYLYQRFERSLQH